VVAQGEDVIPHLVHNPNDILPLRQCTEGGSLDGVSGVDKGHVFGAVYSLHLRLVGGKPGISDVSVHIAVHIIGVQDDNVFIRTGGQSRAGQGKQDA
jgi:hypothetical protein